MTDQELLQAMKAMLTETKRDIQQEIQESEKRMGERTEQLIQESEKRMDERTKQLIQESEKRMGERTEQLIQESEKRMGERTEQLIQESEKRMGEKTGQLIQESEKRIMQNVAVLMDADFGPRFNALSEQIDLLSEKLPDPEVMEILDCRVSALELSVKKLNKEIKQLKAANE